MKLPRPRPTPFPVWVFLTAQVWAAPAPHDRALTAAFERARAEAAAARRATRALLTHPPGDRADALRDSCAGLEAGWTAAADAGRAALAGGRVDLAIVGGGAHAAVVAAAYLDARPAARVVVLERARRLAPTFTRPGRTFRLNSPEATPSPNHLPGADLQLADLAPGRYPAAGLLGDALLWLHATTPSLKLTEAAVARVTPGDRPALTLADGTRFTATRVVVTTGLGGPRVPLGDPGSLAIARRELARPPGARRVEFFADALAQAATARAAGRDPLARYRGRRVAVVGAGDAGMCLMELLAGLAPEDAYSRPDEPGLTRRITWFGQPAETGAALRARTKPRYHGALAAALDAGRFETTPAYLTALEGGAALTLRDAEGRVYRADHLLFAAGYRREELPGLAPRPGRDGGRPVVRAWVGGLGVTAVARAGGSRVYLAGAAAAPLASDEELAASFTKNPWSLENLAPRSAALGRRLATALRPPGYASAAKSDPRYPRYKKIGAPAASQTRLGRFTGVPGISAVAQ